MGAWDNEALRYAYEKSKTPIQLIYVSETAALGAILKHKLSLHLELV